MDELFVEKISKFSNQLDYIFLWRIVGYYGLLVRKYFLQNKLKNRFELAFSKVIIGSFLKYSARLRGVFLILWDMYNFNEKVVIIYIDFCPILDKSFNCIKMSKLASNVKRS